MFLVRFSIKEKRAGKLFLAISDFFNYLISKLSKIVRVNVVLKMTPGFKLFKLFTVFCYCQKLNYFPPPGITWSSSVK